MALKTFNELMKQEPKKVQTRMTPEQRAEVEKAIAAGIANKTIAEFFELSVARVSQIKKEMK